MNKPKAYQEGEVEFFDLRIKVTPDCLIPRLESELLVERALLRFPEKGEILDLCTGSGALGLSIKSCRKGLDVTLSDISTQALAIAKENASINHLEVHFVHGDFLLPFMGRSFDGIICNPPYVTEGEYKDLDPSVKDFEPKIALVGGKDGLDFYRKLASSVSSILKPSGVLCLEIGKDQGESVYRLFDSDIWVKRVIEKDYAGHDRFFFLEKRGTAQLE
jgi:release factor glutamine methyltransferase